MPEHSQGMPKAFHCGVPVEFSEHHQIIPRGIVKTDLEFQEIALPLGVPVEFSSVFILGVLKGAQSQFCVNSCSGFVVFIEIVAGF